jgi:P27 family predicted phage terminase small subunit
MGKRGPPPKPTAQKKLEGTYRKDRDPTQGHDFQPPEGVPAMPKWLDKEAKAEWARVVPILTEGKVLSLLDGGALERYCVAYSNWVKAQRDVQKNGFVVKTPFGPQKNPAVKIAQDERAAAMRLGQELGLSPSARTRVKVAEKPAETDKTEEFLFSGPRLVKDGAA